MELVGLFWSQYICHRGNLHLLPMRPLNDYARKKKQKTAPTPPYLMPRIPLIFFLSVTFLISYVPFPLWLSTSCSFMIDMSINMTELWQATP